ncbi:TPA: helix-turn-helix domain-containing protein [Streptococcus agalactiae]
MLKHFGSKVRNLRVTRNITREDFCGDETELSVRQLARIESGQSIPNLTKAHYIAKQLNVKLDILTGGESLELPKRYKELKYLILRIPTYADAERLKLRECQFDHIFEEFYDNLPEDECLAIDSLQAKFEVYQTGDINFDVEVLCECFDKVKYKEKYTLNDLIIIDLFLTCAVVSKFNNRAFTKEVFQTICKTLISQNHKLTAEDLFWFNHVLLNCVFVGLCLNSEECLAEMLEVSRQTMVSTHDFHKMPLYFMYQWKYFITIDNDIKSAENAYQQSIMFSKMIDDKHLIKKLELEWQEDITGH